MPFPQQVADFVRRGILTGEYAVGERLSENDLANLLNVSRSPVREGLRALLDEGLVEQYSGRGIFVAGYDHSKVQELLELREAFDVTGARLAALRADVSDISRLQGGVVPRVPDWRSNAPMPPDFHTLVLQASGNAGLAERGIEVNRQLRLVRLRSGASEGRSSEAIEEHRSIVAAIRSHDVEAADSAMRKHLQHAATRILELVSSR